MIEKASWVCCDSAVQSPVIERCFTLHTPVKASIEVTGLGYFILFVNGRRVSDSYFEPPLSDYAPRDLSTFSYPLHDTFTHRVYYREYDLTGYLRDGENSLSICLGNGWYRQTERVAEGNLSYGDKLCTVYALKAENKDGAETVLFSDGSEKWRESRIVYNQLFVGEVQDFTLTNFPEHSVTILDWHPTLTLASCPTDRIIRLLKPAFLYEKDRKFYYDAGENVSGFAVLHSSGKGGRCTLTYAEERNEDGTLQFSSAGGDYRCASGVMQIQTDTFITPADGTAREMSPCFVWHGFRYFTIEGEGYDADTLSVAVVHSDVPVLSSFDSDSEALNWLHDAYLRTLLCNMHGNVISDCPHRERLGYTGDGFLSADAAMTMTDSRTFFEKWIRDILDCQDPDSGHVQHTAPFMGGGGGPCGWGGAIIEVPYRYYRHYADTDNQIMEKIREWYPAMCRYVAYIESRSENGLVVREEPGGWCLGDWASLEEMRIPEPYVNSCIFVRLLRELVMFSELLDKDEDADRFTTLRKKVSEAIIRTYYHPETGSFCRGSQAEDSFALNAGIAPDGRTLANLVTTYQKLCHYDTGFFGTDILTDELAKAGETDLLYQLLTTPDMGGYLWMKKHGATTIYEYMNGACSHFHPALGVTAKYLLTYFLGLQRVDGKITVTPHIPAGSKRMAGSIRFPEGIVAVDWQRQEDGIHLCIRVPDGTTVQLRLNGKESELHPDANSFVLHD